LPQLDAILAHLQNLLAADGAALDKIYFCPHHPKGVLPEFTLRCECRKPGSLLYRRAVAELGIDPKKSFVIGDSLRDIGGARSIGVPAFGVRTGYACEDADRYEGAPPVPAPDRMFDDVGAAVAFILRPQPSKRLLYVVSEDWYFLSHRLPMARAARDAGFDVHVATNVGTRADAIAREGFTLHAVPFTRGKIAPGGIVATVRALRRIRQRVKPDLVHRVALQPTVLDAIGAIGLPGPSINAITGLGNTFIAGSPRARILRRLIGFVLRYLVNGKSGVALVQNAYDEALMRAFGFPAERVALIPGSGVDTGLLQPQPEPQGNPTVGFVGRLLADKGIRTLVEAHRILRKQMPDAQLLVAGTPDPANAASISAEELAQWRNEPGIAFLGHVTDIPAFWARAHVAALPSRREGLPKSLLEAAACERAMVATDVPGCRAAVTAGETGLLVPPDDAPALAAALQKLLSNREMRQRMARAARKTAETRFSAEAIGRATVDLYRRLADNI
jgi:glycosyltransferase involved in cell wall biosynthesis